jgi:recombination protein RecA
MSAAAAKNSSRNSRSSSASSTDASEKARAQSLERALQQIGKDHGDGAIMRFGEMTHAEVKVIPTGSLSIDAALGVGGMPRGRVVEIYGPESSGKTTLALHVIASAQRLGGVAAFVDAEHAMDPIYCRRLGIDLDQLLISQPDYGEQALDIVETLVNSNSVDVIVIDSVAALVPKAEIEGEMGDSFVGLQARLMSQALRKLTAAISRSHCVVIFINQLREKIGVMFGSPDAIGNRVVAKIVKNKVAPPFRTAEFDIMYGEGISLMGDLVDLGVKYGVIQKSGAWFNCGDTRLGQGRENTKTFLGEHKEIAAEIEGKVRAAIEVPGKSSANPDGDAEMSQDSEE